MFHKTLISNNGKFIELAKEKPILTNTATTPDTNIILFYIFVIKIFILLNAQHLNTTIYHIDSLNKLDKKILILLKKK